MKMNISQQNSPVFSENLKFDSRTATIGKEKWKGQGDPVTKSAVFAVSETRSTTILDSTFKNK